MSFLTGTQCELLYSLNAPVTKNTYTTAAVFSPLAASAPVAKLPGGYFGDNPNPVGRCLYLKATGTIATTSAATFLPQIGFNPTAGTVSANLVTCYTATAPTAAITAQWTMEAWITCMAAGETGGTTLQVNGVWDQSLVAAGGALQSAAQWKNQFAASVTGLLSSTTYYVELVGTWSASAAGNTTTLQQMFMFGLN